MSNRQPFSRYGGASTDELEHQEVRSNEKSVYSGSEESIYALSSSSGSSGASSHGSCLSSLDGYLQTADEWLGHDGCHYDEPVGNWEWRLAEERHCCHGSRPNTCAVVASSEFDPAARSRSTTSSLLCGVSALLAACSLSSLTACIALTALTLSCFKLSCDTASAAEDGVEGEDTHNRPQIDVWAVRLMEHPLADEILSSQQYASTQDEQAKRYSWDCIAQAGHTKCSPVRKERSRQGAAQSSFDRQYRQSTADLRVMADGVYLVSAQIAGTVWNPPPPTLLRAVIARVKVESGSVNVTAAHAIAGAAGGGPSATARRGTFSVYTAAAVYLRAGDDLQARIICVEEPECVVHVNGTSSYLTLERVA